MSTSAPIRVLIADDHPVVRDGLAALIQRHDDLILVGEAANGQEAVQRFTETKPDVTVMELRMPVMDGVTAISKIREISPQPRIIVLTVYDGDEDIYGALQAGAQAYLLKDAGRSELIDTIRQVAQGQTCIPPQVAAKLAQRMSKPELTARELDVLRLMAAGHSNLEIGSKLFIAEGTVKAHVNNILTKMDVSDRTSAVV